VSKPKNKTAGVDEPAAASLGPGTVVPAMPSARDLVKAALEQLDDDTLATVLVVVGHNRGPPLDEEDETTASPDPDQLVPDPVVWREFGISSMTGWRWTRDRTLDFPQPVSINGRNFRSRQGLERFKARLLKQAITERNSAKRKPRQPNAMTTT
jgi:hypothetical protein